MPLNRRVQVLPGRRHYYHSTTLSAVYPDDDIDSDDENGFLLHRSEVLIDELTDVNEGAKEIIKMWNMHLLKNRYNLGSNIQVPFSCNTFVETLYNDIDSKNLYKNFVLHISHLANNNFVTPEEHLQIIVKLQHLIKNERSSFAMEGPQEQQPNQKLLLKAVASSKNQSANLSGLITQQSPVKRIKFKRSSIQPIEENVRCNKGNHEIHWLNLRINPLKRKPISATTTKLTTL